MEVRKRRRLALAGGTASQEKGGTHMRHGFRLTIRFTLAGLEITLEPW